MGTTQVLKRPSYNRDAFHAVFNGYVQNPPDTPEGRQRALRICTIFLAMQGDPKTPGGWDIYAECGITFLKGMTRGSSPELLREPHMVVPREQQEAHWAILREEMDQLVYSRRYPA